MVHKRWAWIWIYIISFGIIAVLAYWSDVWLPTDMAVWLSRQSDFIKLAVYFAAGFVVFVIAMIVAGNVLALIHFAIDPAYAAERAQRNRVKKLKIGDRLCVTDARGEDRATVIRVDPAGESFDVVWDSDGYKNTQFYFDVELFDRLPA